MLSRSRDCENAVNPPKLHDLPPKNARWSGGLFWYDGYNEWLEKFCARFDSKYFTLVKTTDAFRENGSYIFIKDGKLLYSDYHHISLAGALHLVPVVRRVLEDIAVRRQAEK